jgi:hypothetical protein
MIKNKARIKRTRKTMTNRKNKIRKIRKIKAKIRVKRTTRKERLILNNKIKKPLPKVNKSEALTNSLRQ